MALPPLYAEVSQGALLFNHMQVQIAVKDIESGDEHIFTVVSSETGVFYFGWQSGEKLLSMNVDRTAAHMVAEALRRTANVPEKPKKTA